MRKLRNRLAIYQRGIICYGPYGGSVTTTRTSRDCQPADRRSVRVAKEWTRDKRQANHVGKVEYIGTWERGNVID